MDRLWQDIRYGARLRLKFPGVTAAALLALALGTGVNTALFSIVNTVLLTPRPFPRAEELVQVWPGVEAVGAISLLPIAQTGTNGPVRVPDRVIKPEESPRGITNGDTGIRGAQCADCRRASAERA